MPLTPCYPTQERLKRGGVAADVGIELSDKELQAQVEEEHRSVRMRGTKNRVPQLTHPLFSSL